MAAQLKTGTSGVLHQAAQEQALLHTETKAPARESEVYRILFDAAREGDLTTIRTVFMGNQENGLNTTPAPFDVDRVNRDDCTILMAASHYGRYRVVEFLIETLKASISLRDRYGWTALHHAARNGHARVVQLLLQHGADPNTRDANSCSALMLAAEAGHANVVATLLQTIQSSGKEETSSLDLEARSSQGDTALTLSCYGGHSEVALLLIDAGAEINVRGRKGRTPLMQAALRNNLDLVSALVYLGARLDLVDAYGLSICDYENRSGGLLASAIQRGINMLLTETKAIAGTLALAAAKHPRQDVTETFSTAFPRLRSLLAPHSEHDKNEGATANASSSAALSLEPEETPEVAIQKLSLAEMTKADLAYALIVSPQTLRYSSDGPQERMLHKRTAATADRVMKPEVEAGIQGILRRNAMRAAVSEAVPSAPSGRANPETPFARPLATLSSEPRQSPQQSLAPRSGGEALAPPSFFDSKLPPQQPVLAAPASLQQSKQRPMPTTQSPHQDIDEDEVSEYEIEEIIEDEDEDGYEYEYEYTYEYEDEDEDGGGDVDGATEMMQVDHSNGSFDQFQPDLHNSHRHRRFGSDVYTASREAPPAPASARPDFESDRSLTPAALQVRPGSRSGPGYRGPQI